MTDVAFDLNSIASGVVESTLPATTRNRARKDNPLEGLVQHSYENGVALQTPPVPGFYENTPNGTPTLRGEARNVKNALNRAAKWLGHGLVIREVETDGLYSFVFQAADKRAYNRKTETDEVSEYSEYSE